MADISKDRHEPLYRQIAHDIIAEIRKGIIPAGGILPSISELKRRYPASRVTVVNALGKLVKDGFAVARHGKGFFATSMGEKKLVGVLLPMHSPAHIQIYASLLAGTDHAAKKAGHRMLAMSTDENPERFNEVIDEMILSRGARWFIAVPPMNRNGLKFGVNVKFLRRKIREGISIVLVDRQWPIEFPQFRQDRVRGLALLIGAAVAGKAETALVFLKSGNQKAMRVLEEIARGKGMRKVSFAVHRGANRDLDLIRSLRPDAVLCENDFHARDIMDSACGKVDFLISGYGATPTATDLTPRLTTVNPGFALAGEMAFERISCRKDFDRNVIELVPYLFKGETL